MYSRTHIVNMASFRAHRILFLYHNKIIIAIRCVVAAENEANVKQSMLNMVRNVHTCNEYMCVHVLLSLLIYLPRVYHTQTPPNAQILGYRVTGCVTHFSEQRHISLGFYFNCQAFIAIIQFFFSKKNAIANTICPLLTTEQQNDGKREEKQEGKNLPRIHCIILKCSMLELHIGICQLCIFISARIQFIPLNFHPITRISPIHVMLINLCNGKMLFVVMTILARNAHASTDRMKSHFCSDEQLYCALEHCKYNNTLQNASLRQF